MGVAADTIDDKLFTRLTRAEMLTLGPQDITHPDDWARVSAAVAEMLSGQRRSFDQDERIITPDGSVRWIHLNLSLVRSEAGDPLEFVSIVQDITEQVAAKERLQARPPATCLQKPRCRIVQSSPT